MTELGDIITLDFTVSVDDVLTDPTTIGLMVRDPTGAITTPTPSHDSTGTYHADITPLLGGDYQYKWTTTGVGQAAQVGYFAVEDPWTFNPGPFATSDDIAARWRPLSTAEAAIADTLAGDASTLIRARFPGIDASAISGALDPNILTIITSNMVRRAMTAPALGVTAQSETIGPYSTSQTFANPLGNVFLTAAEITMILGYVPAAQNIVYANDTTASLTWQVVLNSYDGGVNVP